QSIPVSRWATGMDSALPHQIVGNLVVGVWVVFIREVGLAVIAEDNAGLVPLADLLGHLGGYHFVLFLEAHNGQQALAELVANGLRHIDALDLVLVHEVVGDIPFPGQPVQGDELLDLGGGGFAVGLLLQLAVKLPVPFRFLGSRLLGGQLGLIDNNFLAFALLFLLFALGTFDLLKFLLVHQASLDKLFVQ